MSFGGSGLSDIAGLVELLGFLAARCDEICNALDNLNDLEIHTGYDPAAIRRSPRLKESHEELC